MNRDPYVAGTFYENNKNALIRQIKDCYESRLIPSEKNNSDAVGIISPHAGFMYSGPAEACAFNVFQNSNVDTYILLGISHQGCPTCITLQDFSIPLGTMKNDIEFQNILNKDFNFPIDNEAHFSEHSIEVLIPFLYLINKNAKIVPIIVSEDKNHKDIAISIFETIKKTKRNVRVVTSSDFTHYGLNYNYYPFRNNIKENMYSLDKGAINIIESMNSDKFLEYVKNTGATICGKYSIAVAIELTKLLGAQKGKLLTYYTSGDVTSDYSSAVGYAAVKFS